MNGYPVWLLWTAGPVLLLVATITFAYLIGLFRYISNNRIGIVEKMWSGKGSLKSGLIALDGEAGFQPEVLRGGFHFFVPLQYRIHMVSLVTIPQGNIGYGVR